MTISKRLAELETIAERKNADYETAAWTIFEYEDGTYELSSQRLGRQSFETEEEMNAFIDKHHKGYPPEWGSVGILKVSFINAAGIPAEEL